MTSVANKNSFHPVLDYLDGLNWDGIERVETVFQRFLGVSDSHYARSVAKHFAGGAIERVANRSGSKLDEMVVLVGEQGIGKSTIFKKLGKEWFSDSLAKMEGKEAYEALQGWWIIETPELTGMKKSDVENIKHFLAKQSDTFRPAYGRHTVTFNRQCVIVGTTNTKNFLKDKTGNRRFLPLDTDKEEIKEDIMKMNEHFVDQFWAEAYYNYKNGIAWRMDKDAMEEAEKQRESFMDENPLQGLIEEFIKIPIKQEEEWNRMPVESKKMYFIDKVLQYGTAKRKYICAIEIWCELQGREKEEYKKRDAYEINEVLDGIKYLRKSGARKRLGCYGMQRVYDIME
jgi:predicted P-loop ATPase